VFGRRAGEAAREMISRPSGSCLAGAAVASLPLLVMADLRKRMTAGAGVVRSAGGLGELLAWIEAEARVRGSAAPLVAARLVAEAALERRESRGGHLRSDFPATLAHGAHTRIGGGALRTRAA
jgi:L-aspartate oxidase